MVGSILLAAGLVYAADYVTSGSSAPAEVVSTTVPQVNSDWQAALAQAQLNEPQAPTAPDEGMVAKLNAGVQSSNLTQTLGKSLLINLTAAQQQGLGDDIPTQDKLIAQAANQIQTQSNAKVYTATNLTTVPQTKDSLHTYGNAIITTILKHPKANATQTLLDVGYASDYQSQKTLDAMAATGLEYKALAEDLSKIPVPQTLVPMHLQVVNDFAQMAAVFPDIQMTLKDPLRGLAGIQVFQSHSGESVRVLTSIAQTLSKNAILFNAGEAGTSWSVFLSP